MRSAIAGSATRRMPRCNRVSSDSVGQVSGDRDAVVQAPSTDIGRDIVVTRGRAGEQQMRGRRVGNDGLERDENLR